MTYDEFNKRDLLPEDYIVRMRYKYNHEKEYIVSNEILIYNGSEGCHEWLHDWYEGQQDVEIIGAVPLDSLTFNGFLF